MPSSPTFIARFVDGEVVRMTTYHDDERKTLDLKRGVRLARWAYVSRKKQEPPMIESASFESVSFETPPIGHKRMGRVTRGIKCDVETLATYTAEQLAEANDRGLAKD
jgi:hypothetical protein